MALVAPAGFGKSALIADWVRADARPVAWLNTLERDNDPAALLGLLTHAVGRLADMTTGLVTELDVDGVSAWAGTPQQLGAAIRRCDHPFVVVLDNAEKLRNPPAIDAAVAFVEHLPPGSQLVVAARSTSGWPIARLVAAGEAVMFGTLDLAFDIDEARQPLAGGGSVWSNAVAEQVLARTEGWPVAMYLEAVAHRREARTPARAAAAVTGPLRLVSEYVKTEVLAGLSLEDAEFLLRTSHLERLTAGLCDAVLERNGSADALRRIEETCLFLTRLGGGEWYRLQPMLREVLREELQGDPDLHGPPEQARRGLVRGRGPGGRGARTVPSRRVTRRGLAACCRSRSGARSAPVGPRPCGRGSPRRSAARGSRRIRILRRLRRSRTRCLTMPAVPSAAATSPRVGRHRPGTRSSSAEPPSLGRCCAARASSGWSADALLGVERLPAAAADAPLARLLLGIAEVLASDEPSAPTGRWPMPPRRPSPRTSPAGRHASR